VRVRRRHKRPVSACVPAADRRMAWAWTSWPIGWITAADPILTWGVFTHECLAVEVDTSLVSARVVACSRARPPAGPRV